MTDATPSAWAMQRARPLWKELHGWDPQDAISYGWEGLHKRTKREFEAIARDLDAVRRETAEAINQAVRSAVVETPDALTNEEAFGWEHCRDKALLSIRDLADREPVAFTKARGETP